LFAKLERQLQVCSELTKLHLGYQHHPDFLMLTVATPPPPQVQAIAWLGIAKSTCGLPTIFTRSVKDTMPFCLWYQMHPGKSLKRKGERS